VQNGRIFEGIHRLELEDPHRRYSASDVFFDELAIRNLPDRGLLYNATIDHPLIADLSGWWGDCGGGNVVFLVDRMHLRS
jgi:hypothetical protein